MEKSILQRMRLACAVVSVSVLVLLCTMILVGCGGTAIDGTWVVDRIVLDNEVVRATDTDKKGNDTYFLNQIVLQSDNTGTIKLGEAEAVPITWTLENKAVTLIYGGNSKVYALSGSELTYQEDTLKIFYKKSA